MLEIEPYKIIELLYKRLLKAKNINQILVVTTKQTENNDLCKYLDSKKIDFFRGSSQNVLKSFFDASKTFKTENLIRITTDCPFIDYVMFPKDIFEQFNFDGINAFSNSLLLKFNKYFNIIKKF